MTQIERKLNVLDDKGYVIIHDVMGSDLTVVNAARCSYDKKSESLTDADRRLINFLARESHLSPFRHVIAQFEFYSPLMVARQHQKYIVGSAMLEGTGDSLDAWNESSRRYVTDNEEFYVPKPHEWRSAPANSKQGSGAPVPIEVGTEAFERLLSSVEKGLEDYEWALEQGICAEQARLYLNAYGLYVRYYWTASLQSVCHFLNQRLAHDSQVEIQLYAKAVLELIKPLFPISVEKLVTEGTH